MASVSESASHDFPSLGSHLSLYYVSNTSKLQLYITSLKLFRLVSVKKKSFHMDATLPLNYFY